MRLRIGHCVALGVVVSAVALGGEPTLEPTGTLTLQQAIDLALLRNPSLHARAYAVNASEARIVQSKARPNPTLNVMLEEYDRDGQGMDSAEGVVKLSQTVETGGKRRKRIQVAKEQTEQQQSQRAGEIRRVRAETDRRFVTVSAAQARWALAGAVERMTDEMADAVEARVEAGKESPLQSAKAEAALALARMQTSVAAAAVRTAKTALCAMWGEREPHFEAAENVLELIRDEPPSLHDLTGRLDASPRLRQAEIEIRLRAAALAAQKAARLPNLNASLAFQYFEEDGSDAMSFGIGVPLPLFNRNGGNVAAASAELRQAASERDAVCVALESELAVAHGEYVAAHGRLQALQSRVLPAMEQAFAAAREGHRRGKFGFLEVLDAQRGKAEAEHALIDAIVAFHSARIDVELLTTSEIN